MGDGALMPTRLRDPGGGRGRRRLSLSCPGLWEAPVLFQAPRPSNVTTLPLQQCDHAALTGKDREMAHAAAWVQKPRQSPGCRMNGQEQGVGGPCGRPTHDSKPAAPCCGTSWDKGNTAHSDTHGKDLGQPTDPQWAGTPTPATRQRIGRLSLQDGRQLGRKSASHFRGP